MTDPQNRMAYRVRNKANLRRDVPLAELEAPYARTCAGLGRSTEAVYFARCDHHLKIGWTKNIAKRAKDHARDAARYGQELQLVAAVHGTRLDEQNIHKYFSAYQLGPEEFTHADEVTDYVRWLRGQYFVQVPEECDGLVLDVPVVEYQGWGPSPDRRIAYVPNLFTPSDKYEKRIILGDDYYTPMELIALVKDAFGGEIDLDPASHAAANAEIGARVFFSRADNGLVRPWNGRVWLNPPFQDWPEFAKKLVQELPNVRMLLALISCTALTARYLKPVLDAASVLIVPPGRYEFWGPHAGAPTSGHILAGFAHTPEDVAKLCQPFNAMSLWRRI